MIRLNQLPNENAVALSKTQIAIDAKHIVAPEGPFPDLSLRTWRALDAAGKIPCGFFISGRKVWRIADLELWAQLGFPGRREFESQLSVIEARQ